MYFLLIEDDVLWLTTLQQIVEELGFDVSGTASRIEDIDKCIKRQKPDFIISDIFLNDDTVFDYFRHHPEYWHIPTIFLTLSEDTKDYDAALSFNNHAYLVKPVHKLTLISAIRALFQKEKHKLTTAQKTILLKGNFNKKIPVLLEQIVYIEQLKNYCHFFTATQEFTLKNSLVNIIAENLDDRFLQIHRSFVVNKDYIESVSPNFETLQVKEKNLAIGKKYLEDVKCYVAVEAFNKNFGQ